MYQHPSHSLRGQWERTSRASYPSSAQWSGKQHGCETSERWPTSALMSYKERCTKVNTWQAWTSKQSGLTKFVLLHLQLFPTSMSFRTSSVHLTSFSWSPTTCTCCFPSSSTRSLALRFSRSNTYQDTQRKITINFCFKKKKKKNFRHHLPFHCRFQRR